MLGYLWSLARPLLLFGVLVTVFTKVLRFATIPHYAVFLLMNIVLFGFFQEATGVAVGSVVGQEAMVRKTQFPRLVIPLAVVLTCLFNLLLNLVVVVIFMLAFGVTPMWTWLLFPVVAVLLIAVTVAGGDDRVLALPAVSRRGDHLEGALDRAVLWHADLLHPQPRERQALTLSRILARSTRSTPIFELARKWIVIAGAPSPVAAAGGVLVGLLAPAGDRGRHLWRSRSGSSTAKRRASPNSYEPRSGRRRPTIHSRAVPPAAEFDAYLHDPLHWGASMAHHTEALLARCDAVGARSVVEVGAYAGDLTRVLVDWAGQSGAAVPAIDPSPQDGAGRARRGARSLELIRETSLEALPKIELPDVVIIDGDHNY